MNNQQRSYVVSVMKYNSEEVMEYEVFNAEGNPSIAKESAIQKAISFVEQYSDEDNVYLFVMVVVEGQEELFLDQDGNEDTNPIDWLDYRHNK